MISRFRLSFRLKARHRSVMCSVSQVDFEDPTAGAEDRA
jgi:hypothetical protein